MRDHLLGLDAGGRGVRCSVVPLDGGPITNVARAWSAKPAPGAGFFAFDLDSALCWRLLGEAVREAMVRAEVEPGRIAALAASAMRFSLVLVDEEGRTLFAVPNNDARAAEQAMKLSDDRGADLRKRTGHWPTPVFAAPRLLWLAAQFPELVARAASALSLSDWIGCRLTGTTFTNPSQAGATLLLDAETRDWAWDLIDELGIPRRLFPELLESGTTIGELVPSAAEALGLLTGTPVVMGGADTQCGLLGVGATEPRQLGILAGSTTPLQLVMDSPRLGSDSRLWTGHHCVPRRWVLESNAGPLGDTLEWFAAALDPGSPSAVARFVAEAARAEAGADGAAFCTTAQVMNAMEMSLPMNTLSFSQLEFGDTADPRSRLSRAVLEGVTHAIRESLDELVTTGGAPHPDIRIGGGMTRSRLWSQMLCDVLGSPVLVSSEPLASALGAAVCAGTGAGVFATLVEGAAAMARLERLSPDPERAAVYQQLCADWGQLRRARATADPLAAGLALQHMMEQPVEDRRRWDRPTRPLRILATSDLDAEALASLRTVGHVDHEGYREVERLLTGDELVEALEGRDAFITEVDIVDADALLRLPGLRVIAACRGNAVNVDLAVCTALGIPVLSAPGRNAEAVADLALAYMLMLSRKLLDANAFLRKPGGEVGDMGRQGQAHGELQGRELGGKTVGLIGFGAVGRAVTRRLKPFGARVLVHDPHVDPNEIYAEGAEPAALDQLLGASDFVSLHAAVTDETRRLMNAERIRLMKKGSYLINTARGALVDEEALESSLRSGHLAGAALDVFSVEPPGADHPLLSLPNVLATPHIAGNTVDVARHQGRSVAEDLRRMVEGEPPLHVLNPEVLATFSWEGDRSPLDPCLLAALSGRPSPAVTDLHQRSYRPGTGPSAAGAAVAEAAGSGAAARQAGITGVPVAAVTAAGAAAPVAGPATPCAPAGPVSLREQVERVLALFLRRCLLDESLQGFAARQTVMSHYSLNDLGVDFHIGFGQSGVEAALGPPAKPADVRLKAKTADLDAILKGSLGGNRAAMTGRLSFSGDLRLAMGMQKIQPDLIRLYSEAREELGGIDFSADGTPGAPSAAPASPGLSFSRAESATGAPAFAPMAHEGTAAGAPTPAAAASPTGGPDIECLREEMTQITRELIGANLITPTGGNVSVRIPGAAEILITPSQLPKGELSPAMMVRVDHEGNALDADTLAPSSERQLHCEIYKARPDVEAVIHAHAPYATVLTMADIAFLPVSTEAAFLGDIPRVPFDMPGSSELARSVKEALGDGMAVLMQNHGLVVAASSLRHAASTADVIERTAHMIWACHVLKREPSVLPEEILSLLKEIGHMIA